MFVTTYRPRNRSLHQLDGFTRVMDQLWRDLGKAERAFAAPALAKRGGGLRWRDEGDHFLIQALVPGLKAEELTLEATAEGITLKGERASALPEGFQAVHQERGALKFSRTLRLPEPIDPEQVEASLKDGVLTLKAPRRPEAKPRAIEVKVG
jgi:HSP20 family protein